MTTFRFAQIDQEVVNDRLEVNADELKTLRGAFPEDSWPTVERVRRTLNMPGQFYPGRVLVGRCGATNHPVWAYLRKLEEKGSTSLELGDETLDECHSQYADESDSIQWCPWCEMVSSEKSPIGRSGGTWETRFKAMIKIALLEKSLFDGAMKNDFRQIKYIVKTVEEYLEDHDDNEEQHVQPVVPQERLASSISEARFETTSMSFHDTLPPATSFQVKPCHMSEDTFFNGRVFIGTFTNGNDIVWAKVRRDSQTSGGPSRIHYFRGRIINEAVIITSSAIPLMDYSPVFRLIKKPRDRPNEEPIMFKERLDMCVRLALVESGMIQLYDIKGLSRSITLDHLIDTIVANKARSLRTQGSSSSGPSGAPTSRPTQSRSVGKRLSKLRVADTVEVAGSSSTPAMRKAAPKPKWSGNVSPPSADRRSSRMLRESPQQRKRHGDSQGDEPNSPFTILATMREDLFKNALPDDNADNVAVNSRIKALEESHKATQRKLDDSTSKEASLKRKYDTQEMKFKELQVKHFALQADYSALEDFKERCDKKARPLIIEIMATTRLIELKRSGGTVSKADEAEAVRDAGRQYEADYGINVQRTRH